MATAELALPTLETVADVLEKLADMPAQRIRLIPHPGTATEEDVVAAESRWNRLCELWDGVLVDKPMGYYESRLAAVLIGFLEAFLREHDLGIVLGEAGMLRVAPGQVREPDVSFFSWQRFPNRILPPGAILDMTPDLAVEVLSPTNTPGEMARKRREYFAGGTRLVWEVDPERRAVRVYTGPASYVDVDEEGTLDGGDVLPGFRLSVADWFARAGTRAT